MSAADLLEARGEARGEARARAKGAAWMLKLLLVSKFGTLPKDKENTVDIASEGELMKWGVRFAGADSLDDVFRT